MSKPKDPMSGGDLFPDAWIVGKAGADLDSDDALPIGSRTPLLYDGPLGGNDELSDLKDDIEELHQRVADAQAQVQPIDEQIGELGAALTALRDEPDGQADALQTEIARIGTTLNAHVRRQRRANRLHTFLLVIALGLGLLSVSSDYAGAPEGAGISQTLESALQRISTWAGEMGDALVPGDDAAKRAE